VACAMSKPEGLLKKFRRLERQAESLYADLSNGFLLRRVLEKRRVLSKREFFFKGYFFVKRLFF
jgi:hypothetical protein